MTYIFISLLILCIGYILSLHLLINKSEKDRFEILTRVLRENYNARLLIKQDSKHSQTDFLINQLIESYHNHVITMDSNEQKRKELLSNISHDIRTPLTSIIGYLDAINHCIVQSESEKEKYLQIASERSKQLKIILDDIFELAKADANELILNPTEIHINQEVTNTLIEFIPILEREQLQLVNRISNEDVTIYADMYCIHRIIENLVNNAITHGKNGGVIGIETYRMSHEYCIKVWDRGVGISEDIDKLFLRLYKKNTSTKSNNSGLGLAIAKSLTDRNNGRIEVKSIPNDQTSFLVYFPILSD